MMDDELVLVGRRRELCGKFWRVIREYDARIRRLVNYKKWWLSEVDREDWITMVDDELILVRQRHKLGGIY